MQSSIGPDHDEIFFLLRIAKIARSPEYRGYSVAIDPIRSFHANSSPKILVDQRIEGVLDRDRAMVGIRILADLAKHVICPQACFTAVQREAYKIADGRRLYHPKRNQSENSGGRSEEHTSELQSQFHLVCRLLLEKK